MELQTKIGSLYAVVSESGCTVKTPTGQTICTVEAGSQLTFVAPSAKVLIDDDSALVTESFNSALGATGKDGAQGEQGPQGEKGDPGLDAAIVELLKTYASSEGRNLTPDTRMSVEVGHTYVITAATQAVTVTNGSISISVPVGTQAPVVAIDTRLGLSTTAGVTVTELFRAAPSLVLEGAPQGNFIQYAPHSTDVISWKVDGISDGRSLFYATSGDMVFEDDMSRLTNAQSMFAERAFANTVFRSPCPELTNAQSMFSDCFARRVVFDVEELPKVTAANSMFWQTQLYEFHTRMPELVSCDRLFYSTSLASIDMDLFPKLETATYFCYGTLNLETVRGDCPSLKNAGNMFAFYSESATGMKLRSFHCALPVLERGDEMFARNNVLTEFTSELPSLSSGHYMFHNAVLNLSSVKNIAETIKTWTTGTHRLTLGIAQELQGDAQLEEALDTLLAKGWTVAEEYNTTR